MRYPKSLTPSPTVAIVVVIVFVCLQAVGLSAWTFQLQRRRAEYTPKLSWAKVEGDSFALSTSDDENENIVVDNDDGDKAEDEANQSTHLRDRHSPSFDEI